MLTELKVKFPFVDATLDADIQYLWAAMRPVYGTEELFIGRYEKLIRESGMTKACLIDLSS